MALNSNRRPRPKKVPLARQGSHSTRNNRVEVKARHAVAIPWRGIGNFFGVTIFLSILLFFVGIVGFGLAYGYRGMLCSEYFALKTLEIKGNSRLTSREILETADLLDGSNTLALSIDMVEEALARHPWVEKVSVKRVLPGALIIGIKEKTPVFWLLHNGTLYYADAYGKQIAPVLPGKFASLPTLEVEPGAEDAVATLPDLVKSLQDSRLALDFASISLVRLSSARAVELYIENSGYKISIGLEEWLQNVSRLGMTMVDLTRRGELEFVREIRAQGSNVWVERRSPVGVTG